MSQIHGALEEHSPGRLVACLLEADAAIVAQARRRRRQALLFSLGLEAALVGLLVLVPLLTTVARPRLVQLIPPPPYSGSPRAAHQAPRPGPRRPAGPFRKGAQIYAPARIPPGVSMQAEESGVEPPDLPPGTDFGPPGVPFGVPRLGAEEPRVNPPRPASPPPAVAQRPVRRSEGVQEALLIHRVEPTYPPLARQARIEGTVRLHAVIDREGRVESLEVLSGPPLLVQAALAAVRQWRYQPTLLSGVPVEVETYITVIFQLQ